MEFAVMLCLLEMSEATDVKLHSPAWLPKKVDKLLWKEESSRGFDPSQRSTVSGESCKWEK